MPEDSGCFQSSLGNSNGHDGFAMVTRPNDQLECHQYRFCRMPVTRHPVELEQQLVAGSRVGANGVGSHVQNIPKPALLILKRLFPTIIVGPSYAIGPDSGCQSDLQPEPSLLCHGTRIDQHAVFRWPGHGYSCISRHRIWIRRLY